MFKHPFWSSKSLFFWSKPSFFRTQTLFSDPFFKGPKCTSEGQSLVFRVSNVICGSRASLLWSKPSLLKAYYWVWILISGPKASLLSPNSHFEGPKPSFKSKPCFECSNPDFDSPKVNFKEQSLLFSVQHPILRAHLKNPEPLFSVISLLFQTKLPVWGPTASHWTKRGDSRLYCRTLGGSWVLQRALGGIRKEPMGGSGLYWDHWVGTSVL